jgi:hypothetical protein
MIKTKHFAWFFLTTIPSLTFGCAKKELSREETIAIAKMELEHQKDSDMYFQEIKKSMYHKDPTIQELYQQYKQISSVATTALEGIVTAAEHNSESAVFFDTILQTFFFLQRDIEKKARAQVKHLNDRHVTR